MRFVKAFERGLNVALRWFCIILFALLVLLVCWQVFVRLVLHSGNAWTEVAARIIFIWQGLIGAAYVIGEKDDVAIDFFVRKLPASIVKGVEILVHLIIGFFAAWIMVYGGGLVSKSGWSDTVQLLPVSAGVISLAVPIAGGIIVLYTIIHIIETIVNPVSVVEEDDIDITTLDEESI